MVRKFTREILLLTFEAMKKEKITPGRCFLGVFFLLKKASYNKGGDSNKVILEQIQLSRQDSISIIYHALWEESGEK